MFLSNEHRAELMDSLQKALPHVEHKDVRSIFLILYALLCDFQKLETARQSDAETFLEQLRGIEGNLKHLAKQMNGDGESEETSVPKELVWQ